MIETGPAQEDNVPSDSQRLLLPETPQPAASDIITPELELITQGEQDEPETSPLVPDSARLVVPLPKTINQPAEAPEVTAPELPLGPDVPLNDIVADTSSADSADSTPTPNLENTPKPHHRSTDINVISWRAERGHVPSQLLLGRAYFRGDGVPRDMEQARLWLELASIQGSMKAQYELGLIYFIGAGIQQDYTSAHAWWLEAASNGNDKAQQKLGYMYSEGIGVDRDYDQAKNWYLRSANLGNAEAQTLLGSLYHEGNRITHDYNQAINWYQRAAEQGHPHAQYALAILHHDGLGTPQDFVKCVAWVEVALANRYTDELGARDQCRNQLDEQSQAAADALAALWKSQYITQ